MESDHNDAPEKFEWDITTVMVLVLVVMFLQVMIIALGPLGHAT